MPDTVPGHVDDPSSIPTEDVTFSGAQGDPISGYLARPPRAGKAPALIVIHDVRGLGEHVRDVARRFANQGYVALAPDMFARADPVPAGDMEALMARMFALRDAIVLGDLEGAADYLRARDDVTGKLGCIGFCMGGRYTLLFACSSDRLDAAVDCWGGFITRADPEHESTAARPTPPIELASQLACPLMVAIGAEDHNPSRADGGRLREALAGVAHEWRVDVYEAAGHAFFNDSRPDAYRPEQAAVLWELVLEFFARQLREADAA